MNAFYEHHKDSIKFGYRCFERLLGCITVLGADDVLQTIEQPCDS